MALPSGQAAPPDASSVPLPSFAGAPTSLSSTDVPVEEENHPQEGQSAWNVIERCARILRTSPATAVVDLLQDVAGVLLERRRNKLTLTLVGARLSATSRAFMRARRIGLRSVLLCYMNDFVLQGQGQGITVEYLHTSVKTEWDMCFEVNVHL
eukprot:TRINITY_DN36724_c0_g1_i1.p1 TRINITY_DN36724_c0_g1~~TRINITY_DN36724_c0_g1_i1.p1  ORF type:complete len:153 (-),score=15.72 TRINITY_DN36724_c0_g1_i1:291-749(-)